MLSIMPKELEYRKTLALNGASTPSVGHRYSPVRLAVEALFRQRWAFLWVVVTIVGMAAAVTLIQKRKFKSEMMFLVLASRSNAVISADRSAVAPPAQDVTEQQINSEMQLMRSEDVIGAVVDPHWTNKNKTPAQINEHESKIAAFAKHLTLESAQKTNLITVTYRAGSPESAASALEQLSAAYLAKRKLLTRPQGTSEFYAAEMKRYKQAWENANQEMVKFQTANQLVSVPDEEEAITQQILTTENDLRAAQTNYSEVQQRVAESTRLVGEIPQRQPTQQRLSPNQGAIEQLQSMLIQLQNKRTELLNRYQPTDRLVTEIDKQIATTSNALNGMAQHRQSEETTDVSPAWQQLRTGQVQAFVEKQAIQSRIQSLQADLVKLHKQLDQIQPLFLKFNALQEQVEQARTNYETFSQKSDQSNIEDAMDEHKLVNIAVAENPTLNYTQTAPRPLLYMTLGTLTALFLGGSAVYFAESFRTIIATPYELALATQHAVLATIPFDEGMAKWNAGRLGAPIIAGEQAAMARGSGGLVPAMQNLQDAQEV
jgi:uncharacterized protein involved in exopolysaccharide biosynthesis